MRKDFSNMKDRWTVVNEHHRWPNGDDGKIRVRLFGKTLREYYSKEEIRNIEVVPYEEWTAEDFMEILSGEYENANYHRFVNVPQIILNAIKERGYTETEENALMKLICEAMYEEI